MGAYADILALAKDHASDAQLELLRDHLSEESLYPPETRDAIDIEDDGRLVLCRVRLRPLAGKLVALPGILHGSAIGILASVLALTLQLQSREPLTQDASHICLLLAEQGAVPIDDLYARTTRLLAAENRELSRQLFDHLLDTLQSKRVVRRIDEKTVELAERIEL
jgi:hypothetical protein